MQLQCTSGQAGTTRAGYSQVHVKVTYSCKVAFHGFDDVTRGKSSSETTFGHILNVSILNGGRYFELKNDLKRLRSNQIN